MNSENIISHKCITQNELRIKVAVKSVMQHRSLLLETPQAHYMLAFSLPLSCYAFRDPLPLAQLS